MAIEGKQLFRMQPFVEEGTGIDLSQSGTDRAIIVAIRRDSKSPITNWAGKKVLWLGTSIPHQGGDVTSYSVLSCQKVGATCVNMAWAGSSVCYEVDSDPFEIGTIKRLSMTQDDVDAGLELYGDTSAYDDDFDNVNKASRMTVDYRIKAEFAALIGAGQTGFDCVVLDHNHNDRGREIGTLTPASCEITTVTKGVTTVLRMASDTFVSVGDAIALRITGIDDLDYWAGRVQAVDGWNVTINLDTSAYAGALTEGTAYKMDRSKVYGGYEFVIYYIKWAAKLYGVDDVKIILSSAPSEYTGDRYDSRIRYMADACKDIAEKWGLAFIDVCDRLGITAEEHLVYFPDSTHPTTYESRQIIASVWADWFNGGGLTIGVNEYLPSGGTDTFTHQREAQYSYYFGGFRTVNFIVGEFSSVVDDDFSGGIGGWTNTGATPTVEAAPWDAGEDAVHFTHDGVTLSFLQKSVSLSDAWCLEFDLWLPEVVGMSDDPDAPKTITLVQLRTADNVAYWSIPLVVRPELIQMRAQYFESPGGELSTITNKLDQTLEADIKLHIKLESVKATAEYNGAAVLTVNDERYTVPYATVDSAYSPPGILRIGLISSNTGEPFEAYVGNVTLTTADVSDYSDRFSGSFTAQSGETVTVVNGIIVSAV